MILDGSVREAEAALFVADVDHTGCVQRPEAEVVDQNCDGRAGLDCGAFRQELDPTQSEHAPILQQRGCTREYFRALPQADSVAVDDVSGGYLSACRSNFGIRKLGLPL